MGVPKFYRWISERYPCLSETVKELQIPEFDNLYLDMNGIIHTSSHPDDNNPHFRITLEKILEDVCHYIEFLYRIIKPKKVFFMAVDGVAPRAKMNQQRGRRFRSAREAEECERKARESGEILPTEKRFDSNCITPVLLAITQNAKESTEFMVKLHEHLKYFVAHKVSTDPLWQGVRIHLSGHETPGEGEHKIMDFIRHERSKPDYDHNVRHCLYGLDADLMMLGLATHEPHFSLLREEVKFGGKNSQKRAVTPEETTFHLLHLSLFREYLDFEFSSLKNKLPFGYDLENIIDDWVLMGFLVGNDFVPNLPHLHIRLDALPSLWKTYKEVLPSFGGYLNEGGHLNLERFQKYLEELKKFDIERFRDMYTDLKYLEGKRHHKKEKKTVTPEKPLFDLKNQFSDLMDTEDDIGDEILFGAGPSGNTEETGPVDEDSDEIDTFDEEFYLHKRNYYETKLKVEKVTPEFLQDQCEGYIRAIQWILLYYYEGVPSWSWFFPHHYAPYISDLENFSHLEITFDLGTPFLPFQQLMAVLPAASQDLLPDAYKPLMTSDISPVVDFYPVDFELDLNDKLQEWEAVVLIPFIEEDRLLQAMATVEDKLTQSEKSRNKHAPCLLNMYTSENQGPYPSPMPGVFPNIGANFTIVTEVDFTVEKGHLRKGLLPETKLDVYYPGFPTLKHIKHTAYLKKGNVKVFQMNSKGENMMLHIHGSDENRSLEDIAKDYIGEIVYVGWPHLYQAKVVSVSDDDARYIDENDSAKSKKKGTKPKLLKVTLTADERSLWNREVDSITMRYLDRLGIDVGPTFYLIKTLPVTGKKYACEAHGRIILEKQYSHMPVSFVLQATVKNIAVHDPTFLAFTTLSELFPTGQSVFMMGSPHYGCQGEVLEVDESESPRVRINVVIPDEPSFQMIESRPEYFSQQYFPGYTLAQRLGINPHFLSRITGSIFIKKGSPENSEGNVNIGLNLKFTKRNEEVPGYTRQGGKGWTYSEKAMDTIAEYLKKFPDVWEAIISQDNKTDNYFESDIFRYKGATLKDVSDYLKTLPCSSIKTMKAGANILDEGIVQAIENAVNKVMENNKKRLKRVKMQVKPHLLFRPIPNEGSLIPDPSATFSLFDRVVNVREGYTVPFGLRGTVVGIHKAEKDTDTMYEVVFDEIFPGGLKLRCKENKAYRVPGTAVINLSHDNRKHQSNTGSTQGRQKYCQETNSPRQNDNYFQNAGSSRNLSSKHDNRNFSKNAWESNSNSNNSAIKSDYYENSNWNNSKGGYSGGYQGYDNVNQNTAYNGHATDKSFDKYGRQMKQTTSNGKVMNKDSPRPRLDLRQESFDESQKDVPLQFVMPKVVSPGRSQKPQNQQSDPSRAMVTKVFQQGNSSEFADMWKELQNVSSIKDDQTSLNQAAMALSMLPSDPAHSQETRSTSLNVQSLFDEASKSNPDELSSKLKDLCVSENADIEDGVVVCSSKKAEQEDKDKSEALKQILNINPVKKDQPQTKENLPVYGRQLSVQELFDGAKQTGASNTDSVQSTSSNQLHPAQIYKPPPRIDQQHNQPTQYNNQGQQPTQYNDQGQQPTQYNNQGQQPTQYISQGQQPTQYSSQGQQPTQYSSQGQQPTQYSNQGQQRVDQPFGNQGRPKSGGTYQNKHNVSRNPVMQLLHFCQSFKLSEPKYEFSKQMHGGYLCVIYLTNGQRFQGAVTHTQEAAAESAASIALHHLGGAFQSPTIRHPLMMQQQQQRMMPIMLQNMMSPPNPQFSSAFRPVPPTGGPHMPHQNFHGGRGSNHGNWQQKQDHGRQRHNKPYRETQPQDNVGSTSFQQSTVNESGGEQSPVKQSSQSNPFIPLQVTKQQKTPQKKKETVIDDTINNNPSDVTPVNTVEKSSMEIISSPHTSKGSKEHENTSATNTVIDSESKTKRTPPKQQTSSKRKSRIAANFGGK